MTWSCWIIQVCITCCYVFWFWLLVSAYVDEGFSLIQQYSYLYKLHLIIYTFIKQIQIILINADSISFISSFSPNITHFIQLLRAFRYIYDLLWIFKDNRLRWLCFRQRIYFLTCGGYSAGIWYCWVIHHDSSWEYEV